MKLQTLLLLLTPPLGLLLLMMGVMGVTGPVKQAYLHQLVPSEQRATVVSFDSLVRSAGGVGAQGGLGYMARSASIADGYVVGGLAQLMALPLIVALRRIGEPADRIVGQRAGQPSACAAQGLPEIGQVDATPRHTVGG